MGIFSCTSCKSLEKQVDSLRAQLQDQSEAFLRREQALSLSNDRLMDKLLAVTAPGAIRELAKTPSYNPTPRERRPTSPISTAFSTAPAPRPEGRLPNPGRLRPRGEIPEHPTPEQAAAEIVAPMGGDRQVG